MLIKAPGLELPERLQPKIVWARDLQYYEGPLLSEFRDISGAPYLLYWVDCCDEAARHRWLAVRVKQRSLHALRGGARSILDVLFEGVQRNFGYLLDFEGAPDQGPVAATLVSFADLPEDYLPEEGVGIDPELLTSSYDDEYAVLLEGEHWEMDDIRFVEQRYTEVYSIVHAGRTKNAAHWRAFPWRGGYSSVHFFNDARQNVRSSGYGMEAVRVSSPGFINLRADRGSCVEVARLLSNYRVNGKSIRRAVRAVDQYIKYHELNEEGADVHAHSQQLDRFGTRIAAEASLEWRWFVQIAPTEFHAVKTVKATLSRTHDLWELLRNERVLLPDR